MPRASFPAKLSNLGASMEKAEMDLTEVRIFQKGPNEPKGRVLSCGISAVSDALVWEGRDPGTVYQRLDFALSVRGQHLEN